MKDQHSGSSSPDEPEFLAVGMLRKPHGIHGEIVMSVWTDFPERLVPDGKVFAGKDHLVLTIRSVRWHKDDILIAFQEYSSREEVGILRNQVLEVRTEDIPILDEDEIYLHQIIGMTVVDIEAEAILGTVNEIIETGANDVFVVRSERGEELLIPDIDDVILEIDLENNEIQVKLLPGLFPNT